MRRGRRASRWPSSLRWPRRSLNVANTPKNTNLVWRKSTYSTPTGSDCVEVAALDMATLVRDSKDPEGPQLSVSPVDWQAFTIAVKEHPSV
ncbi:DUF397 domain-containing protein [Spirillospora sp. NPDC049652]